MGDRRPQDSGGANHYCKTCKEIMSKEANLPLFNDDYSNDLPKLEKG
jgi:hypothetical protein